MRLPALLPRSIRFLLAHDVRLGWRDFRSSFRLLDDRALACVVLVLVVVMHAAAWSQGERWIDIDSGDAAAKARAVVALGAPAAFILLLMTAQTLNGLTKTLYGHGDLDLLLSSPFPSGTVLVVRCLAVALGAMASGAIFVVPVANIAAIQGHLSALALLPVLAAGALLGTAISLGLVVALFATLGPRWTRLAAQIVATFLGGGFMVWLQISRFMPSLVRWPGFGDWGPVGRGLGAVLQLPAWAAAGDASALAGWIALAVAAFGLATAAFGQRFAATCVAAASPVERQGMPASGRDRPFRTGLMGALRTKEWRLIRRDPWLLSQLLLQILYMTPMLAMLWNSRMVHESLELALAPLIVVVCYQVSASMTWLSLSGEDAPELLATAPVSEQALHWGKLVAVAQLTAMLATAPLLWLATISMRGAGLTLLLSTLAVAMAMMLSLWHTNPAKRSTFAARHRESKILALLEMVMSMLMGLTGALAVVESRWAVAPIAIAFLILFANRPRRRRRRGSPDHQRAAAAQAG